MTMNDRSFSSFLQNCRFSWGCGLQSQIGRYAEERNLLRYLESNSGCPDCSLINLVTELPRIPTQVNKFVLFTKTLLVGAIPGFFLLITSIDISLHTDINVSEKRE
jgi:hypothetical protein